jgi:hypothetical protein
LNTPPAIFYWSSKYFFTLWRWKYTFNLHLINKSGQNHRSPTI